MSRRLDGRGELDEVRSLDGMDLEHASHAGELALHVIRPLRAGFQPRPPLHGEVPAEPGACGGLAPGVASRGGGGGLAMRRHPSPTLRGRNGWAVVALALGGPAVANETSPPVT